MATAILVPRRGWSMDEGTFAGWLRKEGDRVAPGDALFLLETDKAAEEIEAADSGILRIPPDGPKPGDRVRVGQVLAYLAAEGEEERGLGTGARSEERGTREEGSTEYQVPSTEKPEAKGPPASAVPSDPCRLPSSLAPVPASTPRARRVAAELGIDWRRLQGSGRNGRIRERDVRAAAGRGGGRLIPHTSVRRTIAARMLAGATQAAPVTLTTKASAGNLVNLRRQFKATATAPDAVVPSYTDLVLKLTAAALRQHPLLQARWGDDGLFVPDRVDIAFSVDTPAGLFAPVVRRVDQLTLRQVAAQSRQLIALARAGRLTAEQMRDATFTVTNLGGLGVDAFTPLLTLPQAAVLGVGRIVREPAVHEDRIVPHEAMTLSLTFDHRVVDGAPAARFLAAVRAGLENPSPWLIT